MKHALAKLGILLVVAGFLAAAPRAHGATRVYINPGSRVIMNQNTAVVLPYTPVIGPGFIYYPPVSIPEHVIYTRDGGGMAYSRGSPNGDTYVSVNGENYLVRRNGAVVGNTPWVP
jgi:hypothetical protein